MLLRFRWRIATATALLLCSLYASAQTISIDAHVIAAGSTARSSSQCFRMRATIAEPVAGYSSSTDYSLIAGFVAVAPPSGDDIFFSGFEDCRS